MKPDIYDIEMVPGIHSKGIVDIKVVPRDWIVTPIKPDFTTGSVIVDLELIAGKSWVALQFMPKTYKLKEKSKSNKSGDYMETTVNGTLNRLTPESQLTLMNLKGYELVMLAMDKTKSVKLIGNNKNGMKLTFEHDHTSDTQQVELIFSFEYEDPAPFYVPPGAPAANRVLATEDGDILITEDGIEIEVEG